MNESKVWLLCRSSKSVPLVHHGDNECFDAKTPFHIAVVEKPVYDALRERLAEAVKLLDRAEAFVNWGGNAHLQEEIAAFLAKEKEKG